MSNIIVPKFPEVYIPTWREMEVGVGAKIGGELSWELIDTRNFSRPVVVRKGKQKNMILGAMIDWWLSQSSVSYNCLGALTVSIQGHVKYCVLGTGTTAPARDQTALTSQIGDPKIRQTHAVSPSYADYGVYTETTYEFQEDECNGDLTEWGIKSSENTGSLLCRELFRDENGDPVVLTKTSSQVLRMTYRLYAQRTSDYSESSIVCGETTYTCKGYQTDRMLGLLLGLLGGVNTGMGTSSAPSLFYNMTANQCRLSIGSSNLPSTASDPCNNSCIKADKYTFASGVSIAPSLGSYVNGSYEREIIYSFAGSEANMNIGEAAFSFSGLSLYDYFTRVTFDPPIAKDSSKKLKIGVKLAVTL